MTDAPTIGRTIRQRTDGNPLDPNDGSASMVKPAELVDVVELTPLKLVDRRTYNLLLAHAWDRIGEAMEHSIPKAVLRGAHESNDRLSDTIRRLMSAQVEVRIIRDKKLYRQSIHLLATVARPEDEAEDGNVYYRFPEELRDIIQQSNVFARLHTEVMFCFSSKYGLALYEMIQRRGNMESVHKEEFTPEELRSLLGVPKGKLTAFNHFRQKSLMPAVDEVNKYSAYHVDIDAVRHGRKVVKLRLNWFKKDEYNLKVAYANIQLHKANRRWVPFDWSIVAALQVESGEGGKPMLRITVTSKSSNPALKPPTGPNGI